MSVSLSKVDMLEQDIILLKEEVAFLLKAYGSLNAKAPAPQPNREPIAHKLDIGTELKSRGIKHDADQLKRISGILDQYRITDAQILETLTKIAIMYNKGTINNLVGYVHSTFRHEHGLDYAGKGAS